jgi:HAD superfamily hydrolase (TIGR01549 family)
VTQSDYTPPRRTGPVRAVVFDVGETLVNETTEYQAWADWLGVPRHTFSAMFGAVIARGEDYRQVFQIFRPGFDLESERQRRADAGVPEAFGESDLYPDARGCLAALTDRGYLVGIAGNQTARAGGILRGLGFATDFVAMSDDWKAEKPTPGFFKRLIAECGMPADQIAYVGDRLDNDIRPALEVGLVTVFVRRGPWGYQHQHDPAIAMSHLRVNNLDELPDALTRYNAEQTAH